MLEEPKAFVHSFETGSAVDGPGLRSVLFLRGCPLRCLFCQNPDTWLTDPTNMKSVSQIYAELVKYVDFFKLSGGGVTVSGGEPLLQAKFLNALFERLKKDGVHTALDTCGCVDLTPDVRAVLEKTDLVLLDIKHLKSQVHQKLTGQPNDKILRFIDHLKAINKNMWIRLVLLPEWNMDDAYVDELISFLKQYPSVQRVELLPYHELGKSKWEKLKIPYHLTVSPPSRKAVDHVADKFRKAGFDVLLNKA